MPEWYDKSACSSGLRLRSSVLTAGSRLQNVATPWAVFDKQLSDGIASPVDACEEREFIAQVDEARADESGYARRRQKK